MFEIEVQVIRLVKAFNPQTTSLLSLRNHSLHKKSNKKLIGRLSMTEDTNTLKFFIKRFTTYIIHYTQT
jgi:hypothetical protein